MKSIYIARDNAMVPDDMAHYIERHPEDEIQYAKLHIFYDTPIWNASGYWGCAREMAEIPNYMFPEVKQGECLEFLPITQTQLGKVKDLLNILEGN